MAEQYGATTLTLKECHGVPGMFSGRMICQDSDTLTLPVKTIVSAILSDETRDSVLSWVISGNEITITCTNDDYINFIVLGVK